ncbi:hypothetical protein O3P69_017472 [Scylla paramamosain]|uniref:Uncharacterized protein n=1 Tax=Scylla paramamosain TaxID=85552 RepID=A0AAW0TVX9_SCYPA
MRAALLFVVLAVSSRGLSLALHTSVVLEATQNAPPNTLYAHTHDNVFGYIHHAHATTATIHDHPPVKPASILEYPSVDYQGRVVQAPSQPSPLAGSQTHLGSDPSVSPYWADPDGRPPSQPPSVLPDDLLPNTPTCRDVPVACNASSNFRTITGRCNNLLNPHLGTSGQPMSRVLPPVFDSAWMRILSAGGGLLPNPRRVSLQVREVPPNPATSHNLLLMQLGQFVDHDLSVVPTLKGRTQGPERRCEDCDSWRDRHCAPIPIPSDDPHLQQHDIYNQRLCLPFVRSEAVGGHDSLGRPSIEQVSLNTAFLDLSTVYGSDHCRERELRLHSYGMLIEVRQFGDLGGFPVMKEGKAFEECRTEEDKCFFVGDARSNEHLSLTVMHVTFFREHNRLARQLGNLNPHWDDERIYQEARRVNIAQYQHIVYSQFLPELLGSIKTKDYRLQPETSGYYKEYDSSADPSILNEFSTAAFRVGHTMVTDDLLLLNSKYLPVASVPLVLTFHNTSMALLPDMCDQVLRGLMGTGLQAVDLHLVASLVDRLFEGSHIPGQDLFARNIARGREHGLPPYVKYREACGGPVTTTFDDLLSAMPRQAVHALSKAYAKVEDVDLFVGGLAEYPVSGGLVGPTFACLIGYQFFNLRRGDRFWYENVDAGFSSSQLRAIRSSSSLGRVLCDNLDEKNERVPASVFHRPAQRGNPLVPCNHLTPLDLAPWKEYHSKELVDCEYLGHTYAYGRPVHVSHCLSCRCHDGGLLRCQPHLSGCQHPEHDEHCRLVC